VRTCPYLNEDLELTKNIAVREGLNIQIGTMWSNAFNRTTWNQGSLGTNIDVPASFGRFTSTYPSRNIQFYMRVEF